MKHLTKTTAALITAALLATTSQAAESQAKPEIKKNSLPVKATTASPSAAPKQKLEAEKIAPAAIKYDAKPQEKPVSKPTTSKYKHNFYAGVDAMHVYAQHKYLALAVPDEDLPINGITSRDEGTGVGVNVGYKFTVNKTFIAPEIFYEYFKSKAADFGTDQDPALIGNKLEVNQRYGARINVGYNILPRVNVFANAGLSSINYAINFSGRRANDSTKSFQPVYGAGVAFDVSDHWQIKAAYDWQQFTVLYNHVPGNDIEKDRILLQTLKLGAVYSF